MLRKIWNKPRSIIPQNLNLIKFRFGSLYDLSQDEGQDDYLETLKELEEKDKQEEINYKYKILGVTPDSTSEEIKSNYVLICKIQS